ncbi:MAG: ribonuclease E [Verrucomicrobiota bacterium]
MFRFVCASLWYLFGFVSAPAAITFTFDFEGTGFNDPVSGMTRQESVVSVARDLGAWFDHEATVHLTVNSSNDPNGDLLASAGSEPADVGADFFGFTPSLIQKKILTGIDDNGSRADGEIDVNFGQPWDFDDEVSADHYDFKSTLAHEMLHALGFLSAIFRDGSDAFGTRPGDPGVWEPFDQFLSDQDGNRLIDGDFALDGDLWESVREGGTTNGLFFEGPKAVAANGGQRVGLYSPSDWEEGSSGSHLDDEAPLYEGMLMLAAADTGPYARGLSAIERAILEDIGYRLAGEEAPVLEWAEPMAGQTRILRLTGEEGSYVIEESRDLQNWEARFDVEVPAAGMAEVMVDPMATDGVGFFRARAD